MTFRKQINYLEKTHGEPLPKEQIIEIAKQWALEMVGEDGGDGFSPIDDIKQRIEESTK